MMKKQITNKWAVGLTAVLAMAMLCGCGAGADSAGNYKSEAPAAATEAAAATARASVMSAMRSTPFILYAMRRMVGGTCMPSATHSMVMSSIK